MIGSIISPFLLDAVRYRGSLGENGLAEILLTGANPGSSGVECLKSSQSYNLSQVFAIV